MAKNKGKGQKQKNVFHVANNKCLKAKNKAKPVKTNLKKINVTNEKVATVNKAFTEIQEDVAQLKKDLPTSKLILVSKPVPETPADIDDAVDLISQL
ncbi:ribosomal biogenesis factor [Bombina bombina]|uniref:ribosomal biogenesis factor n=1 Tax=Bombina bombina TaxID=8345 RepID=UPI00235A55D7|nr:ribosomal biogenesis factor [Bombina bombina]XP_053571144.1 ribosomal biogenesis factor [Bombina bombina]